MGLTLVRGRSISDGSKLVEFANAQMGGKEIKRYCAGKKEHADRLLQTAPSKLDLSGMPIAGS